MVRNRYAQGALSAASRGLVPGKAPQRRAASVHAALRRAIVLGELAPGALLGELQLGVRFGCSQGSVREALFRLQEEGLVRREGYRGTSVSRTSVAEVRELLALRLRLEPMGVRAAAGRLDGPAVQALGARVVAMEEIAMGGDLYAMSEADRDFHLAIFAAAALPALEPVLARCFVLLHRFALADPSRRRTAMEVARRHWPIVEALGSRSVERAVPALEAHIATVVEGLPELARDLAA